MFHGCHTQDMPLTTTHIQSCRLHIWFLSFICVYFHIFFARTVLLRGVVNINHGIQKHSLSRIIPNEIRGCNVMHELYGTDREREI